MSHLDDSALARDDGALAPSILVVEDDQDIREVMTTILEDRGCQVTAVANGDEALCWLREARPLPELIFLDLMMPIMDGESFRRAQLEDARIKDIPVVVLSARPDVDRCAERMAASRWLRKPIDLVAFVGAARVTHA
jgi:CheY-like chemotaxis protein